jgi:hypothetical protein
VERSAVPSLLPLKENLNRELQNARIVGGQNMAESRAAYCGNRIVIRRTGIAHLEVGVIEDVEVFTPDLDRHPLADPEVFEYAHVPVEETRTKKLSLAHVSKVANRWKREC